MNTHLKQNIIETVADGIMNDKVILGTDATVTDIEQEVLPKLAWPEVGLLSIFWNEYIEAALEYIKVKLDNEGE